MRLYWQQIPSTIISEMYSRSTFDGVVLDTEHGSFNNETLYSCIQIITSLNKKCFIRFTHLDKTLVRMCLDAGCTGAIFSTIESKNQAKKIIKYCKYPLQGGSRGQGLVRENIWGNKDLQKSNIILIAQIETKKGIDNLESILDLDFDYYMTGPYDLSASLGCVGDWTNKQYLNYLNKFEKIPKAKRGTHLVKDNDIVEHNLDGYGFIALGMDTTIIMDGIKQLDKYNN